MEDSLVPFRHVLSDVRQIISAGRTAAYAATNREMLTTYWNVGRRIVEEEQKGEERAEYGKRLIAVLAKELTAEFGSGFFERNLRRYRQFYLFFPDPEIWTARGPNLSWTHFRSLLRVPDEDARLWYLNEASVEGWSSRTLDRNIATQYYYRLLQSPKKEQVVVEMKEKTAAFQKAPSALIKSPIVAEFLGFRTQDSYVESDLESALLAHLTDFMLEMGRGFAFVARQQHIVTETEDYYIDLVFYNIELRCYVLIDLKIGKITHQDVGQIDMYTRMYDDLKRNNGENPTIGILLCSETDEDVARYSILHDSDRLFMAKYLTYLPTKEQLRVEIERQKQLFYARRPNSDENAD